MLVKRGNRDGSIFLEDVKSYRRESDVIPFYKATLGKALHRGEEMAVIDHWGFERPTSDGDPSEKKT